jgi:hypothetical protein
MLVVYAQRLLRGVVASPGLFGVLFTSGKRRDAMRWGVPISYRHKSSWRDVLQSARL